MADLILRAPLKGWSGPLDEAPDAVFAQKMMGDGLAIDPTEGALYAPCDATVIGVHHTRHAVSLRAANGAELLIHIGLDTVGLGGEGFETHVAGGQAVKAGALLVSFDLDLLARRAKSLLTPIVVTNGEAFAIETRAEGREVVVGEPLMTLRALGANAAAPAEATAGGVRRSLTVPLAHGLHARPAAQVAALAKTFPFEINVGKDGRSVNAKSPVAILTLGVRLGDAITLTGDAPGAAEALEAIAALIEGGMGELASAPPAKVAAPAPTPAVDAPPPGELRGVKAAPGLAIGVAARLVAPSVAVETASRGAAEETRALDLALAEVKARIAAQVETGPRHHRAILAAHLAFLDDPDLTADARRGIGEGLSAGLAWRGAIEGFAGALKAVGDPHMAERVADLMDLERQVLVALSGEPERAAVLPRGAILLADDLLPSQVIGLDPERVAGLCTARGGPTSHVAILAAAMNLPALVAAGPGVADIAEGVTLILDADAGRLIIGPDPQALEAAQGALAARRARREAALASAKAECRTADGVRIEVFANLGAVGEARAAVAEGAEGCGLLRTEFLFMDRADAPSEDEQADAYQAIAEALDGRPLIVRTLDIGGDKPVDYLPIPAEENPALGLRGVRVGFWRPQVLRAQIRAILRVRPYGQCRIMLPMVASVGELTAVRAIVTEVAAELGHADPVQLGVMVETPAAAMTADLLAAEADFLSVGTNDLSQYALAMDRGNPLLAAQVDGLHPAVLRLVAKAAEGGAAHGRMVGVCGGLASDLMAVPILVGLGVSELSAAPAMVAEVKALVRSQTLAACRDLAAKALACSSPAEVRRLAAGVLDAALTGGAR